MKIESYELDKNINILCVTAVSFPDGVTEAHKKLHSIIPFLLEEKRCYFGISRPEGGEIVYKVGAEVLKESEVEKYIKFGLEPMTVQKGKYTSVIIKDYIKDISSIGKAFKELLSNPKIDPEGHCVEWYLNDKDVRCMVRLKM
jgi:hypothetical protein